MAAEQREHMVYRTVIELHWLCAEYAHGKDIPAWLHHMLVYGRQRLQVPVTCGYGARLGAR